MVTCHLLRFEFRRSLRFGCSERTFHRYECTEKTYEELEASTKPRTVQASSKF